MTELAEAWLKVYYPTPANRCRIENALEHSILKWTGLTDLKCYKLKINEKRNLVDSRGNLVLLIDSTSCALCFYYYFSSTENCLTCPLAKSLGRRCMQGSRSPWQIYANTGNPVPMLQALLKARAKVTLPVKGA